MVGWKESKFKRNQDKEWTIFGSGYDKVQAFVAQLENVVHGINEVADFLVSPEDALASVAVIETAYEALRDSRWHAIGPAAMRKAGMPG